MALYLQMDGVDDKIKLPSITFSKVIMDIKVARKIDLNRVYFDFRSGFSFGYLQSQTNGVDSEGNDGAMSTYIDGVGPKSNNTVMVPDNVRCSLEVRWGSAFTDDGNVFSNSGGSGGFQSGSIYNIKFYNDTTLVAHYDMTTGNVNDISGNGNHATLTGGTWLDDGTGDTGTDGSTLFDVKQVIYQDSDLQGDTKQTLYADEAITTDLLQRVYSDEYISNDTKQVIYSDEYTQADTKQIIYELSSTAFDTLQEYYEDGQIGSTPFDMRMVLYLDGSTVFDSVQAYYESGSVNVDLKQAIYESGLSAGDMRLIIYAEEAIRGDLRQLLYSDAYTSFDTKQVLYDAETQVIGVIKLKGKRQLYVYLKGNRELEVRLKGGLNVTEYNQNFSMESGDSKVLSYAIDDDLNGATLTWEMYQRGQTTPLISKTGTFANANVQIELIPTDTQNVYGTYRYELQCVDVLSKKSTLAKGVITLE